MTIVRSHLVILVAVALLIPSSPTHADEEAPVTCQGETATIVGDGTYGDTLYGTDGPDVIVTNRAHFTDGGAGDDLVCVTGEVGRTVRVNDGTGDDEIHNLSSRVGGPYSDAFNFFLFEGDDKVVGGPSAETVFSYEGTDDIDTAGGVDSVLVSEVMTDAPFTGTISLGADGGAVRLWRAAMDPDAVLDGGEGPSSISLEPGFDGSWMVDNESGTATRDGAAALHWTGFTGFGWSDNTVRFIGTDRAESLGGAKVVEADLAGGDDRVALFYSPEAEPGSVDGGAGSDRLTAVGATTGGDGAELFFDAAGVVTFAGDGPSHTFSGFESLTARGSDDQLTTMVGTAGPDVLEAYGCDVVLRGGPGDDTLTAGFEDDECRGGTYTYGGPGDDRLIGFSASNRLYGQAGNDVLRASYALRGFGGRGNDTARGGSSDDVVRGGRGSDLMLGRGGRDLLDGQQGRDTARGGPGRDRCRAEVRTSCEAR